MEAVLLCMGKVQSEAKIYTRSRVRTIYLPPVPPPPVPPASPPPSSISRGFPIYVWLNDIEDQIGTLIGHCQQVAYF
jgi:hypothetical protein